MELYLWTQKTHPCPPIPGGPDYSQCWERSRVRVHADWAKEKTAIKIPIRPLNGWGVAWLMRMARLPESYCWSLDRCPETQAGRWGANDILYQLHLRTSHTWDLLAVGRRAGWWRQTWNPIWPGLCPPCASASALASAGTSASAWALPCSPARHLGLGTACHAGPGTIKPNFSFVNPSQKRNSMDCNFNLLG